MGVSPWCIFQNTTEKHPGFQSLRPKRYKKRPKRTEIEPRTPSSVSTVILVSQKNCFFATEKHNIFLFYPVVALINRLGTGKYLP